MAEKQSRSRRHWILYTAVALGFAAAAWYFVWGAKPQRQRYPQPAWAGTEYPLKVPVRTVAAQSRGMPVHVKAIGTVTALNTVAVKSRVDGPLLRLAFEEGQRVERGALLAEIDPAPYRIRLAEVEGELQQAIAQLESARSDLARMEGLHAQRLLTDQQFDLQKALIAQREGAVRSVQARVDNARLQLGYTRIEAPISGRAGLRHVDAGNLVRANDASGLVVIAQTDPISVAFTIPETQLAAVLEPFRAHEDLKVEAWDRDDKHLLATGRLTTLDNQIDIATGTLRLKAQFPNADDRLFPNQFVNVRMHVRTLEGAVVIPSAAVQFGSRGTYVFVVDAEQRARIRDVVLGPVDGPDQAVLRGLKAGEAVILEGLDRLREGSAVVIGNPSESPIAAAQ